MKKTFALLAALMLVVMMLPTSAMAYDKATLTNPTTFDHKLQLTYALNQFDSDDVVIAYKYTVGSAQTMTMTKTTTNGENSYDYAYNASAQGVTGAPAITGNYTDSANNKNYAYFNKDSTFDANKTAQVTLSVDWSNVNITEPGIYLWEVTKALDTTISSGYTAAPSDNDTKLYLYAIVTRTDGDTLTVTSNGMSEYKELNKKSGTVEDQYPAKTVSLTIEKEIAGNMASSNQYFSFAVTLTTMPNTYNITGKFDTNVPQNMYNAAATNDSTITVAATGSGTKTFWLKAGQSITISGLPYGSHYAVVEGNNVGYTVAATLDGDTDATKTNVATDYTVTDTNLTSDSTVTYTNTKDAITPTGITLHTAAPVMGLLLAMSLLAILYLGKRKEAAT